jgi:hypothetical protein
MKIDPNEIQAIRKALEKLVNLLEGKLLADGYFQEPSQRAITELVDVRIVDGRSVWLVEKQKQDQQRRLEQLTQQEG